MKILNRIRQNTASRRLFQAVMYCYKRGWTAVEVSEFTKHLFLSIQEESERQKAREQG